MYPLKSFYLFNFREGHKKGKRHRQGGIFSAKGGGGGGGGGGGFGGPQTGNVTPLP